ncbi:MAG TPA: hypothetical protein VNF06_02970 [Candidatus Aquilonibacter sp.]|nr:hypothetical protein [Candidatus Aquilonibacter sp.]
MKFLQKASEVAKTKLDVLDAVSEMAAKMISESKSVQSIDMPPNFSGLNRFDVQDKMKELARKGNGHIGKIEVSKPINDHSAGVQHSLEVSFQGLNGAITSYSFDRDHARMVANVNDPAGIFSTAEDFSKFVQGKNFEFLITVLDSKHLLSSPKETYKAVYMHGGEVTVGNDKQLFQVLNVIEKNVKRVGPSGISQMNDIFVLNPDYYKITEL